MKKNNILRPFYLRCLNQKKMSLDQEFRIHHGINFIFLVSYYGLLSCSLKMTIKDVIWSSTIPLRLKSVAEEVLCIDFKVF